MYKEKGNVNVLVTSNVFVSCPPSLCRAERSEEESSQDGQPDCEEEETKHSWYISKEEETGNDVQETNTTIN
jgi:hypothetical protein